MSLSLSLMDLGTLLVSLLIAGGAHMATKRWSEFEPRERSFFFYALVALSTGLVADFAINDILARLGRLAHPPIPLTTEPQTMAAVTFASYWAVKLFVVVALVRLTLMVAKARSASES